MPAHGHCLGLPRAPPAGSEETVAPENPGHTEPQGSQLFIYRQKFLSRMSLEWGRAEQSYEENITGFLVLFDADAVYL